MQCDLTVIDGMADPPGHGVMGRANIRGEWAKETSILALKHPDNNS